MAASNAAKSMSQVPSARRRRDAAHVLESGEYARLQQDPTGFDLPAVKARQARDQQLAQFRRLGAVAEHTVRDPCAQGVNHRRGNTKVHVGGPQRQDVLGVDVPLGAVRVASVEDGVEVVAHPHPGAAERSSCNVAYTGSRLFLQDRSRECAERLGPGGIDRRPVRRRNTGTRRGGQSRPWWADGMGNSRRFAGRGLVGCPVRGSPATPRRLLSLRAWRTRATSLPPAPPPR